MYAAILGGVIIGLSLALLGAGGAILTIPILEFGFGIPSHRVSGLALIVVSLVSITSFLQEAKSLRSWRAAGGLTISLWFSSLGSVSSFFAARFSHLLPEALKSTGFSLLLFAASVSMLKSAWKNQKDGPKPEKTTHKLIAPVAALILGAVTGVFGVGGGFLLVPTILMISDLNFRFAALSSLFVIVANSLTGLAGHKTVPEANEVYSIVILTALGMVGSFAGKYLKSRFKLDSNKKFEKTLKTVFAVVLLVLAARYFAKLWV